MTGRSQARAAEEAGQVRFPHVEALSLQSASDHGQGGPLAAEVAGSALDRIAFRERLTAGTGGCAGAVDVGVASKVADDRSSSIHMKVKPLGDFIGG
jgi:hypothetical protein